MEGCQVVSEADGVLEEPGEFGVVEDEFGALLLVCAADAKHKMTETNPTAMQFRKGNLLCPIMF